MSKLIFFNMMSIDGFFEGPSKEIDWHNVDNEFNDFAIEQLNNADALVFGRVTYELMAAYWPKPEALGDDPVVARKMNSIQKIVFSKSMKKAEWGNTRLVKGNAGPILSKCKQEFTKDIFIFGSADLAFSLRNSGLIDEYRILINPVLLGRGNPLFKESNERHKFKLMKVREFKNGNVLLIYEPVLKL